jgi:hypothetical protein
LSEGLVWPPRKEDLERLYLVDKLSAMKIAEVYGLKYKNPKVAESTVLYQLKKNGIKRRDPAEHIRTVTESMVDEWVKRYEAGDSLKRIAGESVDSVTVWNHLKARGLVLRDKVEAQIQAMTKYERKAFGGDEIERAYLKGLRYGDLDAVRHGRGVRVRVSTTHPAMASLFENLFSAYGHIAKYARPSQFTGFEWNLECDLDSSFDFLLIRPTVEELGALPQEEFAAFLAGFFDAEGSILFHRKGRWGGFELAIANMDFRLLDLIAMKLEQYHCSSVVVRRKQDMNRGVKSGQDHIWRLEIYRGGDVRLVLGLVRLRHPEKIRKAAIVLHPRSMLDRNQLNYVAEEWERLAKQIEKERDEFVSSARKIASVGPNSHAISRERKIPVALYKKSPKWASGHPRRASNSNPSR